MHGAIGEKLEMSLITSKIEQTRQRIEERRSNVGKINSYSIQDKTTKMKRQRKIQKNKIKTTMTSPQAL